MSVSPLRHPPNTVTDLTQIDNHKIVVDDESYNYGHGHAYDFLGVDPAEGAVIVVRPDQYVSMIAGFDEVEEIRKFFGRVLQAKQIE